MTFDPFCLSPHEHYYTFPETPAKEKADKALEELAEFGNHLGSGYAADDAIRACQKALASGQVSQGAFDAMLEFVCLVMKTSTPLLSQETTTKFIVEAIKQVSHKFQFEDEVEFTAWARAELYFPDRVKRGKPFATDAAGARKRAARKLEKVISAADARVGLSKLPTTALKNYKNGLEVFMRLYPDNEVNFDFNLYERVRLTLKHRMEDMR